MTSAMTPAQVSANILSALQITAPGLSMGIGTPERKIVDAVAEAISESYIDTYLLNASFDIDTKTGTDLDQFVGIFGFGRLQGQFATGVVTFSLGFTATQDTPINNGTQIFVPPNLTSSSTTLYYSTTQTMVISQGTISVDIPVQCTVMGSIGNTPANTITGFGSGGGIATVTNLAPCTGGTDVESDDHLRQRFKQTFLRNIAGTSDFYQGLMIQSQYTNRVAVIGPYSTWREELQFNGTTKIFSTNPDVKYTWPSGWFLYQFLGLPNEVFYTSGTDYVVDTTVTPPGITPSNSVLTAAGAVGDFEYQYTSTVSRNDPANGITNRVDVFIDGQQVIGVTEYAAAATTVFNTTTGSPYNVTNFLRDVGGNPATGNTFQALGSTPITTAPSVIYGPSTTYTLGTNYHAVYDNTLIKGSSRELTGIEWITTPPTAGQQLIISYSYNKLPAVMQALTNINKQIATDVLIHQATYKNFQVYSTIVYDFGANITTVNANINTALTNFFNALPFGAWIQFSDINNVIHNVSGVDNVRMSTSADVGGGGNPYGINWVINSVSQAQYTADFKLNDNEVAAFAGITITRRASNNF